MKKSNINLDQKKRLILIVICSVALVILVLLTFYFISHERKTEQVDANQGKKLQGVYIDKDHIYEGVKHTISGERCTEGNVICIRDFEIIYDGSKGIIKYKIANHSTSAVSGHIKINIGKDAMNELDVRHIDTVKAAVTENAVSEHTVREIRSGQIIVVKDSLVDTGADEIGTQHLTAAKLARKHMGLGQVSVIIA